jgi:hypothetical protein
MKKITTIAISMLLMISLTGCGYDGGYRYKCQDPANWKIEECNPPICEASGTFTKDLIKTTTTQQTTTKGTNNG